MTQSTAIYNVAKTLKVGDAIKFTATHPHHKARTFRGVVREVSVDEQAQRVELTYERIQMDASDIAPIGTLTIVPGEQERWGWQSLEVVTAADWTHVETSHD
jgi:hypothetical protein